MTQQHGSAGPATAVRPYWSQVLRALREARGITRETWAGCLGYSRTTVQRWESGALVPDAAAEAALLALCAERQLFRHYEQGFLHGCTVTPAWLSNLLAEARPGDAPTPGHRGAAAEPPNTALPTGTVTFLLTDVEGSTERWEADPQTMRTVMAHHDRLLAAVFAQHGGVVVKPRGDGDSLFVVFPRAADGLAGALAGQRALQATTWASAAPLRVRMALHSGEAELRDGDYYGSAVNRCARIRGVASGGQILLSQLTASLAHDELPEGCGLAEVGAYRLRGLSEPLQLVQLVAPDLPATVPAVALGSTTAGNLPTPLTSFIGREQEVVAVRQLLTETRLLTLTGSGGVGKSRLALELARSLTAHYPDGVWLVELAALRDPTLVPQAVATVLGLQESPGQEPTNLLTATLRAKTMLLILDNCEHLLNGCAGLAETLLRSCAGLRILATSREPLGLGGETLYRLPSLSLPSAQPALAPEQLSQFEAIRLFVERARAVQPRFAVSDTNAQALVTLCRQLDGIPLALELAAARVTLLTVEQIAARLGDRFRLLTSGSRTALPRQQTLRAALDWSYELLTVAEQRLLRRLAVFAGGWSLEAAEAVGGGGGIETWEVVALLGQLVDKSLVVGEPASSGMRYRLLETTRQYAAEQLERAGEAEACHARHLAWYEALVNQAAPVLRQTPQAAWLEQLEQEHDNLRSALAWAVAVGATEPGLRLAGAAGSFWDARGYWSEGRDWLAQLLERASAQPLDPAVRATALRWAGILASKQGDYGRARADLTDSLTLLRDAGDKRGVAQVLGYLAHIAGEQGDWVSARPGIEESLSLFRELGDLQGVARMHGYLARIAFQQRDFDGARAGFEYSLTLFRKLGDKKGVAWMAGHLAHLAASQGDFASRRSVLTASLALFREVGDTQGMARALGSLAFLALDQQDYTSARAGLDESLSLFWELGDKQGLAVSFEAVAALAVEQQPLRAGHLLAAASALRLACGTERDAAKCAVYDRSVERVHEILGEDAVVAAWADGEALTLEQAVTEAFAVLQPESAVGAS